jgi:Ni/Co efflux regulator RcnB
VKNLILALSVLSLGAPLYASAALADPYDHKHDHDNDRHDHDSDRHDHADRDWRHDRSEWRDERRDARWDAERHDGYWYGGRWFYGPPPAAYYGRPGFALGYHAWARGARLPRYYFDRRYYVDWRAYRLRPPPRGYYWVRDERGDFLLAAVATGLIADLIINSR